MLIVSKRATSVAYSVLLVLLSIGHVSLMQGSNSLPVGTKRSLARTFVSTANLQSLSRFVNIGYNSLEIAIKTGLIVTALTITAYGAAHWMTQPSQTNLRLLHAAKQGDLDECIAALQQGADVNVRLPDSYTITSNTPDPIQWPDGKVTPLRWACHRGHIAIINFLVARGAIIEPNMNQTLINQIPLLCEDLGLFYQSPERFRQRIAPRMTERGIQVLDLLGQAAQTYHCPEVGRLLRDQKKQVLRLAKITSPETQETLPQPLALKIVSYL